MPKLRWYHVAFSVSAGCLRNSNQECLGGVLLSPSEGPTKRSKLWQPTATKTRFSSVGVRTASAVPAAPAAPAQAMPSRMTCGEVDQNCHSRPKLYLRPE